ncbi:amidohydrolase family protein [Phycicoccus sp. CSK15P-2]|uniref:amidohydrolase family protein n=1 Tax=Phycicoccus sp. CSK15P-2 TaxID=2807627 RepID=UPI001951F299|nr:amidohydrolase family protein [Phycicoccus sp. CSK15P-2]MBM6403787.1 amidohydrolase family protein [Phycicoccus sp. CSK15P-2]
MITVIENARVFDGATWNEPHRVAMDGPVIVAHAGPADVVVDAAGGTLLPGLVDAHMHTVSGRPDLEQLVRWGVTTGLDMAAWPAEFVDRSRSEAGVAQIFSATIPAVGPGGNHARLPGFPAEGVVTTPEEGCAFVARRVADGADYVKIVTEAAPPAGMTQQTVDAIVHAAHTAGLLVVAHSVTTGAFDVAIAAGVDVSTHAPLDAVLDDRTVQRMVEAGMVSVPTLTMMRGTAERYAAAGLRYEHARATVAKLHAAGIPLLVGTDSNSAPATPFAPRHGESLHDEMQLLLEAGLSPTEILAAATSGPARHFGLEDRGRIAPGRRADLLLVDGDPTVDLACTRSIRAVWLAGERVR